MKRDEQQAEIDSLAWLWVINGIQTHICASGQSQSYYLRNYIDSVVMQTTNKHLCPSRKDWPQTIPERRRAMRDAIQEAIEGLNGLLANFKLTEAA